MRAQLMSLLALILFVLLVAELLSFAIINIQYSQEVQTASLQASLPSTSVISSSAQVFGLSSLSRAVNTLFYFESNPSLRMHDIINDTSLFLEDLVYNGTIPYASNELLVENMMRNYTLQSFLIAERRALGTHVVSNISVSFPQVYQLSPYYLSLSFLESVSFNSSGQEVTTVIPIVVNLSLSGLPDLFYSPKGIYRPIIFADPFNLTESYGLASSSGPSGFISGSGSPIPISGPSPFSYGVSYNVPSFLTCTQLSSLLPSQFSSPPLSQRVIIITQNANSLGTCINNYGGIVTDVLNSTFKLAIPYLIYPNSSPVYSVSNGTKVLLSETAMSLINIEGLKDAIQEGLYFASPFASSYLQRAQGTLFASSSSGITTFAGFKTLAATFNALNSSTISVTDPLVNTSSKGYNTVTFWMYWNGTPGGMPFSFAQTSSGEYDLWFESSSCFGFNTGNGDAYGINPSQFSNKWVFVAAEFYNGPYSLNNSLFINGVKETLSQCAGSSHVGKAVQSVHISGLGSSNYFFSGQISNLQIYNTVLPSSMIDEIYQEGIDGNPLNTNSLVGWWPLNGNANDYSGYGYNGIPSNVAFSNLMNFSFDALFPYKYNGTYPLPGINCYNMASCQSPKSQHIYLSDFPFEIGPAQAAFLLSGSKGYIEQQSGFSFMNNANQPFSISVWVYPTSSSGVIVDELGQSTPNTGWHDTWIELVNGNVYIRVWNLACVNLGSIPLDAWSNIVMVGSVSSGTLTYSGYIDGAYRNSGSGTRSVPGGSSLMYYPLGVGDSTNCGSGAYFSGAIANYQFYNASLNASSIQSIYSRGVFGQPINNGSLVMWLQLDGNTYGSSGNGIYGNGYNVSFVPVTKIYSLYSPSYYSSSYYFSNEWGALGLSVP
ncbi:MAG: LamG-like jellyroll fold domain-containing protein [Candidatus Micrarchaeaceae archaeon]